MDTLRLLLSRKLGPLFATQFFGAFNDNLFKQAIILLVVFQAGKSEQDATVLSSLAGGLFILPFFLFSSLAGQLSDKFDKARVLKVTKACEIFVMGFGALGFWLNSPPLLFAVLFLMGTQSAFFGPAKFSILPEHLKEQDITRGNGLLAMSTFVAIITGSMLAGQLGESNALGTTGLIACGLAVFGALCSLGIPAAPSAVPDMRINRNFFKSTLELYRITKTHATVHLSIMGLSWFWFIGALMLTLTPAYTKYTLGGDELLAVAITITFVCGIVLGSLLCILLSKDHIELGLVPLGALGMTVFGLDLYFMGYQSPSTTVSVQEFFWTQTSPKNWRVIMDLTMIAVSAELFQIPLFALIQTRSEPQARARVIAGNNILNAIFMVGAAITGALLAQASLSTVEIFAVIFGANLFIATYIFLKIPEFTMRFIVWFLARTIYRIRFHGRENIPAKGPAVIVANHVSWIDWFILTTASGRPVRYVIYHTIYNTPGLNFIFRLAKAIPIAPAKEDAQAKEEAFRTISKSLQEGQIVCIFPEGQITSDGKLNPFRPGVEQILQTDHVPVIPVAMRGLWGSYFSREGGRAMLKMPKPSRRVIEIDIGKPMSWQTSAATLEEVVSDMLAR